MQVLVVITDSVLITTSSESESSHSNLTRYDSSLDIMVTYLCPTVNEM